MVFEKATNQDIKQLTRLRVAYLMEDYGALSKKELAIIERDLPDYFYRNLNNHIFAYIGRCEQEIIADRKSVV